MDINEILKENLKKKENKKVDIRLQFRGVAKGINKKGLVDSPFTDSFVEILRRTIAPKDLVISPKMATLMNQLIFWLTLDDRFKGDYRKGILIAGPLGNGKTDLMMSFTELINLTEKMLVTPYRATAINSYFAENNRNRKHIYIDDLGREPSEIYVNYTKIDPLSQMIYERYTSERFTFFTTNVLKSLGDKQNYPASVVSRLKEMCNIFIYFAPVMRVENNEVKI